MAFRTTQVRDADDVYRLRELSGYAVHCVQDIDNEMSQGFALIALSLTDEVGRPLYLPESVNDGVDYVMSLPTRVSQILTDAVQELNSVGLDDARKK